MAFASVEEENTRGSRYSGSGDPRAARPRRRRRGTLEARGHRPRGGKAPGLLRSSRMPPLPRRRRRRGCTRYSVSLYHRQRSKIPNVVATCERARVNSFFLPVEEVHSEATGGISFKTDDVFRFVFELVLHGRRSIRSNDFSDFEICVRDCPFGLSRSVRYRVQQW